MKKRIIMCVIASAMICSSLASCGKSVGTGSSSSNAQPATTAAPTEEATAAASEESTEAQADTTAPASQAATSAVSGELIVEAARVLNNLNSIDYICGGSSVEVDESTVLNVDNKYPYTKVTDSRFSSVEDVKKYVTDAVCGSLLESRYKCIYEGEPAMFTDSEGSLWFLQGARGCGFSFNSDPVISDVTDDSFTITANFDDYGSDSTMVVKAVKENGLWKASSFSINGEAENRR